MRGYKLSMICDGKRLKVAIPHDMEPAPRASRALVMHQVAYRELRVASVAIEPLAAVFAAQPIGNEDIRALENNVRRLEANTAFKSSNIDMRFTRAGGGSRE